MKTNNQHSLNKQCNVITCTGLFTQTKAYAAPFAGRWAMVWPLPMHLTALLPIGLYTLRKLFADGTVIQP